jgi:hypothetical protein
MLKNDRRKEVRKKANRKYYSLNREHELERSHEKRLRNIEYYRQKSWEWNRKNKIKMLKYYVDHKDQIKERAHKHYLNHKREFYLRVVKRERNLKCYPLNKKFPGSEEHHLTKEITLFIPRELHRSISHNIFSEKNMKLINEKAIIWWTQEDNEETYHYEAE